jgi:hypothetical protein
MSETEVSYTIIPAQPGWGVITLISGNEKYPPSLWEEQIIAWEIKAYTDETYDGTPFRGRDVFPITTSEQPADGGHWAFKRPDGKYDIPFDRSFDNDVEMLGWFLEQEEKRRKRQEAKQKATVNA